MRDYKELKKLCEEKRGLYANIHAKRKRGEAPARPGSKDYPRRMLSKRRRGLPKKVLNSKKQPGPERKARKSLEVLMRKEGNLTKEKILEATLKHQARRLEIPAAHRFVLE